MLTAAAEDIPCSNRRNVDNSNLNGSSLVVDLVEID
jgi:hypothetical protein